MDMVCKEDISTFSAILAMLWQLELLLMVRLVQWREYVAFWWVLDEWYVLLLLHLPERVADDGDNRAGDEKEKPDARVAPIIWEAAALAGPTCAPVMTVVSGRREDLVVVGGSRVPHKALGEHRGLLVAVRVEEDREPCVRSTQDRLALLLRCAPRPPAGARVTFARVHLLKLKLTPRSFLRAKNYTERYIRYMCMRCPCQKNRFESIRNPFAVLSMTICPVKLENYTTGVSIPTNPQRTK